ncbi:choice-of-anchor L domain-containing protein [Mangrovicoccus sp. HB161399]|uniref:choice-of-anchor L domain-containing protein n=1 Tax=Mangrovicoccus sp. HB161399 TaxID=2720392 RepID=UPI001C13114C|nr:choice-of-anchor L domain-containing protein [Mangrovicoccus sp. HB161399]
MPAFTQHSGASAGPLASALLSAAPGITIVPGSVVLQASAPTAIGYYDGSLSPLGIGAGIILTSGRMPGTANTSTSFGADNGQPGSPLIDAVINPVFKTVSYDASTLSFRFEVTDPAATSISFDLIFGSDEFPEWVDQYVDSAVVYVNGVNYAYFSHHPAHPLSVISQNLAAGYYRNNNGTGLLPIEYDGVSNKLTIVAPILPGQVNEIAIGISDTGDHILDSGIILSGLAAGTLPGSGVVIKQPGTETEGDDLCVGTALSEVFDLKGGDDTAYGAGGDDIMSGGAGKDSLDGGSGNDALSGGADDDWLEGGAGEDTAVFAGASASYAIGYDAASSCYAVASGTAEGTDTLSNVELAAFSDGLFALTSGGLVPADPGGGAANTPGAITLSGIAAEGQVLTAAVSDVDGIPGAVAYVWQRSTDGGASWNALAETGAAYTVTGEDAGAQLRVLASYSDGLGAAEALASDAKTVTAGAAGDLKITLLQIAAPQGASVESPLTTLVLRAIELGMTPNTAQQMVKTVLQLPGDSSLLHWDPLAAVLAAPGDAQALEWLGRLLQVAILTSLGDDDTGAGLAVKMIDAWQAGGVLDLASAGDLGAILGIAPVPDAGGKYPEPLNEIEDRCASIASIVEDGGTLDDLDNEWADFASVQEEIAVGSIAGLVVHINQAPQGCASGILAGGAGTAGTIAAADLLAGFADPEGAALSVSALAADQPGTLQQLPGGSWSFTPLAAGPVEFSYVVSDPEGAGLAASIVMIVAPKPNTPPVAADDFAATAENASVLIDVLANDGDADPGDVPVLSSIASAPAAGTAEIAAGKVAYTPLPGWFGTDSFGYQIGDGNGGTDSATVTVEVAGPEGLSTGPVVHDSSGQAWDVVFDIFDAGHVRVGRVFVHDDGRVREIGWQDGALVSKVLTDGGETENWQSISTSYGGSGAMTGRVTVYDAGRIVDQTFQDGVRIAQTVTDGGGLSVWHTMSRTYAADGTLTGSTRVFDDGHVIETVYGGGIRSSESWSDPGDAFVWSAQSFALDASGTIAARTLELDNGVLREFAYAGGVVSKVAQSDLADAFDWSIQLRSHDAQGTVQSETVVYDDGRIFVLDYAGGLPFHGLMSDPDDAWSWAAKEYFYGPGGALLDVVVTPDPLAVA